MTEHEAPALVEGYTAEPPEPPFNQELLPAPVAITAYSGDSLSNLSIDQFSLYGVACVVDHRAPVPHSENSRYDWLTERQELALLLGAMGMSAGQSADFLVCGGQTINTNRRNGLRRLGAQGKSAIHVGTRKLVETGVVTFTDTITLPFAEEPRIGLYLTGLSEGKTLEKLHLDVMRETGMRFRPDQVKTDIRNFRKKYHIPGMSLAILAGMGAGKIHFNGPAKE